MTALAHKFHGIRSPQALFRGQPGRVAPPLSPASSLRGTHPQQVQPYTEGVVQNSKTFCVNGVEICVNRQQIADAARERVAKELARETGVSTSRVYDLRAARFHVSQKQFLALAQACPSLKRLIDAALSGEAEANSPEAIDKIMRGK